eukprot:318289_1
MLREQQIDLDNRKPTPFTLLFAIYNAKLALNIKAFEDLDIAKQCDYLQKDKINLKSSRRISVKDLISKETMNELSDKAHIRIIIKYVLSLFYKETEKLKTTQNIGSWSKREIILSFISHLITASADDQTQNKKNTAHPKIWEFVNYLRRYFNDINYNGQSFLNSFTSNDEKKANNKPTKGFGLEMMKTVCSKYQLKSGPFSKVKKQCNVWATKLHAQSQGKVIQPKPAPSINKYESIVSQSKNTSSSVSGKPHNYSKFVTDVSMYVSQQQPSSNKDNLNGKKWYWFNDSGGFKWIPYRDTDIQKLNTSWRNNQKSCLIINGEYRVEFDRSNPNTPAGNQYNNRIQNPGGRTVICSEPRSEIHGIQVGTQPL